MKYNSYTEIHLSYVEMKKVFETVLSKRKEIEGLTTSVRNAS